MRAKPGQAPRPLTDDRLWNAEDVAGFLSVSRSMVYKLEQAGELPCVRIGARVRFDPAVELAVVIRPASIPAKRQGTTKLI